MNEYLVFKGCPWITIIAQDCIQWGSDSLAHMAGVVRTAILDGKVPWKIGILSGIQLCVKI